MAAAEGGGAAAAAEPLVSAARSRGLCRQRGGTADGRRGFSPALKRPRLGPCGSAGPERGPARCAAERGSASFGYCRLRGEQKAGHGDTEENSNALFATAARPRAAHVRRRRVLPSGCCRAVLSSERRLPPFR